MVYTTFGVSALLTLPDSPFILIVQVLESPFTYNVILEVIIIVFTPVTLIGILLLFVE